MHYVTSFVGTPPTYWYECIYQIRLFSNDSIWCITNQSTHAVIQRLKKSFQNIFIVDYNQVRNNIFDQVANENRSKFQYVQGLHGREHLFLRSLERFFLCSNLMKKSQLSDVLFLEIDNLIYENAETFLSKLKSKPLGYMFDNVGRSSSGIMYIRDENSLDVFLKEMCQYIQESKHNVTEMVFLYKYAKEHADDVQYLPVHPPGPSIPTEASNECQTYQMLFDAASLGVYLYGNDTFHTNGRIKVHQKNPWSLIDYTKYTFSHQKDEFKRNIPYIHIDGKPFKIFNLHIHSKQLRNALSKP